MENNKSQKKTTKSRTPSKAKSAGGKGSLKKILVPIISVVICIAIAAPLLWYFVLRNDTPSVAAPLRAVPVSAAALNADNEEKVENWDTVGGVDKDHLIGGVKYSELPFRVLDSYSDGYQSYYLIDMGCVRNTNISTSHLVYYNGKSPVTSSVTTTTTNSIAESTSKTVSSSYAFTSEVSQGWSIGQSLEVSIGGAYLSQSYNHSWATDTSSSLSKERSTETSFESIIETTTSTTTEFTVGEHGESAGWYRYGMYAIVDVFVVLTTTVDRADLLHWETSSAIRTNSILPHFEYSSDGSFENTPISEQMLLLPDEFWKDLPAAQSERQNMFADKVASSADHSLYIDQTGKLWAFGRGEYGKIGDGSTVSRISPVHIKTDTLFSSVSVSDYHSLAIDIEGNLWAWGRNDYGQLGDFTTTGRTTPVKIFTKKKFAQISAGILHSLAIDVDGNLWAWGRNTYGQLGTSASASHIPYPVQITADEGSVVKFKSISAGYYFSAAIDLNGNLWMFGRNDYGQLGDGTTHNGINTPTAVIATTADSEEVTTFRSVSCGNYYTLAIDTLGRLWAFGRNNYGQLGDGTTVDKHVPTQITAIDGTVTQFKSAVAGIDTSIVIDSNGSLMSSGRNDFGQLGNSTNTHSNVFKITSADYIRFSALSVGLHILALDAGGELWSWGYNGYGQLGTGNTTNRNTPAPRVGI